MHTPVSSSNIKSVEYNAENNELEIIFRNSRTPYIYSNVTRHEYTQFLAAKSKGSHFASYIKNKPTRMKR